jgi:hypothetical protein
MDLNIANKNKEFILFASNKNSAAVHIFVVVSSFIQFKIDITRARGV